ncbi:alpha/beta fold hydrolase [Duganella sp. FT92W]|uniref:Alpha/beta fold hydrolase n=1 Tax=Pseudoduganella rivuli TaxID=2666085 RepID=A0A7X2LUI8_9BURK|nr:alpha/beta hydrolase [Pseudoduganella rivuli]MRV75675.1 alpha/beta fold hydrolase [Pseudoduganella rivuli]
MTARIEQFGVPYGDFLLRGDHYAGARSNHTLLLHGAGASTRHMHHLLRNALQERGVGTTCFECVGHGETGGLLAQSSVASRTRQAEAVIAARAMDEPLALIGISMGAYNAIRLTQSHPVDALVLMVPGVYPPDAYEVPFGPAFSAVIRRERSWMDTDAWDILARFEGALLVVAAEHDAVIPLEIPERLVAAAGRARQRELMVVEGGQHNRVWALLAEQPERFDAALGSVIAALHKGR